MPGSASGEHTRPSLLLRVRDPQDAAAWETFVAVYGSLVYGHARRRGLQHPDAEDVRQRVFARVMSAIRTFEYRPEVGRFRDWLGTLVRNEVNRFLRQESRGLAAAGAGDVHPDDVEARREQTAWDEAFHAHVLRAALTRARPHFEDATWKAFELVWLQNRPAAAAAAELGVALDKIYVAKSRVLRQLWAEVQELADDAALVGQLA